MRVYINPQVSQVRDDNGIGRVIHAQWRYLPDLGIELVSSPDEADVIACHVQQGSLPRVDVLHCHGLYWTGDTGSGKYDTWHHDANGRIIEAARRATRITVPSEWVAMPFKRDMRINPIVIGHGIDTNEWAPGENGGYVLWNKNRAGDVCDPMPAYELAKLGVQVVSTFGPRGVAPLDEMRITGTLSHAKMHQLIEEADIYLATTKETFGIGTLEAMAAGVPVLGYSWGGTADLIHHQVTGYLVNPGDIEGLRDGLDWLRTHRADICRNARSMVAMHNWPVIMQQYADLYQYIAEHNQRPRHRVSVVVTNYNYGTYLAECIDSLLVQTVPAEEIIIVDDGSTDNSLEVAGLYQQHTNIKIIAQKNQGVAAARNNGTGEAEGEYVVCLDADDKIAPTFIETLSQTLQSDAGIGIAWGGLAVFDDAGHFENGRWRGRFNWDWQASVHNPPRTAIPTGAMFRKAMWERCGGYLQEHAPGEDAEFYTRGLSVGFAAKKATEEDLLLYRMHGNGAHTTKPYKSVDEWLPWMRDKQYPMGVPSDTVPFVRSYSAPLISIIMPVGEGHEIYLPEALNRLLGQTLREWEVIVVNDADEGFFEVLTQRLRPFPFAHIQTTGGLRGPGAARNIGLKAAQAPLSLFLDVDDWLAPNALELMLAEYRAGEGYYVYTDWYGVAEDGTTTPHQVPEYSALAWLDNLQHGVTALVPTQAALDVGGFDETLKGWEEWDFFAKLAVAGVHGKRLAAPLLYYRVYSGQRRRISNQAKKELSALIRERYQDYKKGDKAMAGCCGNTASTKQEVERRIPRDFSSAVRAAADPVITESGLVRMKFIGSQRGSMPFKGPASRKTYRGGNNENDQYIDADPRDVDHLLSLGSWALVQRPAVAPPEIIEPKPAEIVMPEPIKEDQHVSDNGAAKLVVDNTPSISDVPNEPRTRSRGRAVPATPRITREA